MRSSSRAGRSPRVSSSGTGKYPSHAVMQAAHEASGTEMVTVAVRRVDLNARGEASLLSWIDRSRIFILPNTAALLHGGRCGADGATGARGGLSNWIKLEVIGDERTLFPGQRGAARGHAAARQRRASSCCRTRTTIRWSCRKLEDAGAAAVMPLGAPIGSGLGHSEPEQPPDHQRTGARARDRRRRRRHGLRRRASRWSSASTPC